MLTLGDIIFLVLILFKFHEEPDFCFQVLLDMLSHSAAVILALARHPVSTGKDLMSLIETSILELLSLTKDSISEVKVTTFAFLPNSPML